jgi:hypothetical protein
MLKAAKITPGVAQEVLNTIIVNFRHGNLYGDLSRISEALNLLEDITTHAWNDTQIFLRQRIVDMKVRSHGVRLP